VDGADPAVDAIGDVGVDSRSPGLGAVHASFAGSPHVRLDAAASDALSRGPVSRDRVHVAIVGPHDVSMPERRACDPEADPWRSGISVIRG
jgi:hypothetical protein